MPVTFLPAVRFQLDTKIHRAGLGVDGSLWVVAMMMAVWGSNLYRTRKACQHPILISAAPRQSACSLLGCDVGWGPAHGGSCSLKRQGRHTILLSKEHPNPAWDGGSKSYLSWSLITCNQQTHWKLCLLSNHVPSELWAQGSENGLETFFYFARSWREKKERRVLWTCTLKSSVRRHAS